jgi:hypothetical protein
MFGSFAAASVLGIDIDPRLVRMQDSEIDTKTPTIQIRTGALRGRGVQNSAIFRWGPRGGAEFREKYARAREAQADGLVTRMMQIVENAVVENAAISKARLQFDAMRWHAGKLAPKRYGDRVEHDHKGGVNFQPQILIQCSSAGDDEGYIDISAAPEAAGSLPQQGNGNSLPGSGGRR